MERVQDQYNSAVPQFPQPSRPIGMDYSNMYEQSYPYPYPFYGGYYEPDHQESGEQYMERVRYPFSSQLSRPVDIGYVNIPEESFPNQLNGGYNGYYFQESKEQYVSDDCLFHILGKTPREHDGSNAHEIFRKFISRVKKEVHFDRLEEFYRLVNSENDLNASGYQERSIDIEASSRKEDIKRKLERFKIKNLNLGGIVKEEKQS